MIAKGADGRGGSAVEPVFALQRGVRLRLDAGSKLDAAPRRFEFDRDREAAASAISCQLAEFRPA